jgi:hypothetical protein
LRDEPRKEASARAASAPTTEGSFEEMNAIALEMMKTGTAARAAGRSFLGRKVSLDATIGGAVPGICDACYEMFLGKMKFIAGPHPDLSTLKFTLFVGSHGGKVVHLAGTVGGTSDWPGTAPLVVSVESMRAIETPPVERTQTNLPSVPSSGRDPTPSDDGPTSSLSTDAPGYAHFSAGARKFEIDVPIRLAIGGSATGSEFSMDDVSATWSNLRDGVVLRAWLWPPGTTLEAARSSAQSSSAGSRNVTYSAQRGTWFVLSGHEGERAFYERTMLRTGDGAVASFRFTWSGSSPQGYDADIKRMSSSFKFAP